jgi:chromosome transmission fidelity protein 8
MPSVPLYPPIPKRLPPTPNPLPSIIQTPSGLALLEIQGTLHSSSSNPDVPSSPANVHASGQGSLHETPVGRLVFPNYNPSLLGEEDQGWLKRVYLYVGKHQRLTGEVKKLGKPVAVLRKRERGVKTDGAIGVESEEGSPETAEELEIVEIVRFKILFAGRPEPVGE